MIPVRSWRGGRRDWRHYPDGEVYDEEYAQYFSLRAPRPTGRCAERGRFHTFLRAEGMPRGVTPLLLPSRRSPMPRAAASGAAQARGARRSEPPHRDRARSARRANSAVYHQSLGHRRDLVSRRRRDPHARSLRVGRGRAAARTSTAGSARGSLLSAPKSPRC